MVGWGLGRCVETATIRPRLGLSARVPALSVQAARDAHVLNGRPQRHPPPGPRRGPGAEAATDAEPKSKRLRTCEPRRDGELDVPGQRLGDGTVVLRVPRRRLECV